MDSGIPADSESSYVTDEKRPDPAWINGCDDVTDRDAKHRAGADFDPLQEELDYYRVKLAAGEDAA